MSQGNLIVAEIMKAQETGTPLKVYRKAITGKVAVRLLNPFSGEPAETILYGTPGKDSGTDIEVRLWTSTDLKYFETFNRGLIQNGTLVLVAKQSEQTLNTVNALDDDSLRDLVTSNFLKLKKSLTEITSETTLQRALSIAEEENRSAKVLSLIKERLAEVQQEG